MIMVKVKSPKGEELEMSQSMLSIVLDVKVTEAELLLSWEDFQYVRAFAREMEKI